MTATTGRLRFVRRRILQTIPLLLGIIFLVFALLQVTPGDPARLILGPRASDAEVEQLRQQLGLDDSLPTQYVRYVGDVATGDFGESVRSGVPVATLLREQLPVTLLLLAAGSLVAVVVALPLAQLAARRRGRPADHVVRSLTLVGLTMPPFWVGLLLLVLVAVPTGWFPTAGYGDTVADNARSLVLPSLTLGLAMAPILTRSLRSALIGVRESDYVTMAHSLGLSSRRVALRHELPNAVLPAIVLLGVSIGYALFGVVIIENTFGLPGLGLGMLDAVVRRDFPVVQGITLVFAVLVVLVHLLVDVTQALIDPRVEIR